MKKTLLTATAAVAMTAGAIAFQPTSANAGISISVGKGWGGFHLGAPVYSYCHYEYRWVPVTYWSHKHGRYITVTKRRRVRVC